MLRAEGCQDGQLRKDLGILALFHDIGAYRTEEISRLLQFEPRNIWEHAIYSYLFLRTYFPQVDLAKVVLYHHTDWNGPWVEDGDVLRYAQLLHVADRACIWHDERKGTREGLEKHLDAKSGTVFSPDAAAFFREADRQYGTWKALGDAPLWSG